MMACVCVASVCMAMVVLDLLIVTRCRNLCMDMGGCAEVGEIAAEDLDQLLDLVWLS